MPQAIVITLDPRDLRGLPADCTGALHRQVFHWLEQVEPSLADTLHNKGHLPGARTSQLGGRFSAFTLGPSSSQPDNNSYFLTTLSADDELYSMLGSAIINHPTVEVDGVPVRLGDVPRLGADRSYQDLVSHARRTRHIELRFATATFFESDGMRIITPDPVRIFNSYAERWNAFAPEQLCMDLDAFAGWLRRSVSITDLDIRRARRSLRKGNRIIPHMGFTGTVHFEAHDSSGGWLSWLNCLADYAEFCGTGRMVAQGFGQTWREA